MSVHDQKPNDASTHIPMIEKPFIIHFYTHLRMYISLPCAMLISVSHTHIYTHTLNPQVWLKTLFCAVFGLTLVLLWKLWADLTLIEESYSWWGALAWDVLQMYHEWCISNYSEAVWNVMTGRQEETAKKQKGGQGGTKRRILMFGRLALLSCLHSLLRLQ